MSDSATTLLPHGNVTRSLGRPTYLSADLCPVHTADTDKTSLSCLVRVGV